MELTVHEFRRNCLLDLAVERVEVGMVPAHRVNCDPPVIDRNSAPSEPQAPACFVASSGRAAGTAEEVGRVDFLETTKVA